MDDETLRSRLSQISTRWTLLRDAHEGDRSDAQRAHAAMFERYHAAAYRYLVAVLKSPDVADDVFQDFAVRVLKGDLQGASPEKGRFRNYLKTILSRMAIDHFRRRKREGVRLDKAAGDVADPAPASDRIEADFDECWRTELLEKTWSALASHEAETKSPYYTALLFQSQNPGTTSKEMAVRLSERLQPERPFTDAGIRQIIHRARSRFAELLIDEVERSIDSDELDAVEAELASLKLLQYCEAALQVRRRS